MGASLGSTREGQLNLFKPNKEQITAEKKKKPIKLSIPGCFHMMIAASLPSVNAGAGNYLCKVGAFWIQPMWGFVIAFVFGFKSLSFALECFFI